MIKASDLRIGNKILDYSGNIQTVLQIFGDSYQAVGKHGIGCLTYEYSSGISLSEDWLIRMGFTRVPHFTVTDSFILDIGRNRIISIGNVGTGNEMIWLCEIDPFDKNFIKDLICVRNYDYDGLSYVHTIQNIGHALTGSELTIKE